jgi:hypothetical protein
MVVVVMITSDFRNTSLSMTQRFRMWVLGFNTTYSDTSYQSFGETCRLRPWRSEDEFFRNVGNHTIPQLKTTLYWVHFVLLLEMYCQQELRCTYFFQG